MVISFIGQKGGVGKSTCAIAVACELFARGARVALVDADEQGTVLTWKGFGARAGIKSPMVVGMDASLADETQAPELANLFSYVVIDCPGRADAVTMSALAISHLAILPCGPTPPDGWALASSTLMVKQAQRVNPALKSVVLVNKLKPRTRVGRTIQNALLDAQIPAFRTQLCDRVTYQEFLQSGQGVCQYAPGDVAATEVAYLVNELLVDYAGATPASTPAPTPVKAAGRG